MINSLILSPSILFHKHQTILFDALIPKNIATHKDEQQNTFFHFNMNKNPYTMIISVENSPLIKFVKGHLNENSYKQENVILQTYFNILAKDELEGTTPDPMLVVLAESNTPTYESLMPYNRPLCYSGFDKTAFTDILSLLESDNTHTIVNEIRDAYFDEYEIVSYSITRFLEQYEQDFQTMLDDKSYHLIIEEMMDRGNIVCKVNNALVLNRDSYLTVCEKTEDSINIYSLDKERYHSTLTDDEDEFNTIFFDNKDLLYKQEACIEKLKEYKVASISKDGVILGEPLEFYMFVISVMDCNSFFFMNFDFYDKKREVIPDEVFDLYHTLLSSSNYYWHLGSLYNPNKLVSNNAHISFDLITKYRSRSNYRYSLVSSNPLMTSYTSETNEYWKEAIKKTLIFAKGLVDKSGNGEDKYNELMAYQNKILGHG